MIKVVADTNALLMPFQRDLNIDAELKRLLGNHEMIIPEPIIGELERLAKTRSEARAALALARTRNIFPTVTSGDDAVLELAEKESAFILTNDKEVIQRATAAGLKVIRLREGVRLAVENEWMD
jgi:rRNA-processing protein FCF1